jgi:hypothetical protein
MNPTQIYVLHLMDCALNDVAPAPLPAGADFKAVCDIARLHNIEGLIWAAASKLDASQVPADVAARLENAALNTVYRRLQFDIEREAVFEAMAKAGLAFLPLKGVRIATYYPDPSMRAMVDNDVLYGFVEAVPATERDAWGHYRLRDVDKRSEFKAMDEASDALAQIMLARGYSVESLKNGKHDTFHKQPMFNFEMHRRLIETHKDEHNYFANPWRYAIPTENVEGEGAEGGLSASVNATGADTGNESQGRGGSTRDAAYRDEQDVQNEAASQRCNTIEAGALAANAGELTADQTCASNADQPICGEFMFRPEEEYIHFLAHAWEHYSTNGVGIRTLADAHVILRTHEAHFDEAYLREHLQMAGLTDFEATLRGATDKLFGQGGADQADILRCGESVEHNHVASSVHNAGSPTCPTFTFPQKIARLSPAEADMVECMFKSGSHGSIQVSIERQLAADSARGIGNGASKLRYALGKIFVSPAKLKAKSDTYARYPFLIVFSPLQRLAYFAKYFAKNPNEAKRIKQTLKNTNKPK